MDELDKSNMVRQEKLIKRRTDDGLTVDFMADFIGCSVPNYYKKEKGHVRFFLEEAQKIADYFNTSIEELFVMPNDIIRR